MPKFAVGHIDWSNNDLIIEIVEAPTLMESFAKHSKWPWKNDTEGYGERILAMDVEDFKRECFDCDCMMDSVEIAP